MNEPTFNERVDGELYRDEDGYEVWRLIDVQTGEVIAEGVASDHDARAIADEHLEARR